VLYGFDEELGDDSPTVVSSMHKAITALPATFTISVPPDALSGVKGPGGGPSTNVLYFIRVWIDQNGDGKICQGEPVQSGGPDIFDQPPAQLTFTVTPKTFAACEVPPTGGTASAATRAFGEISE
jgi:hypothetical protein